MKKSNCPPPKNILLGICGCIAAYKVCDLIRTLRGKGYDVKVILTKAAGEFVTETTLRTLSRHPVYTDVFMPLSEWSPEHIELTQWADIMVVCPASANMMAKAAWGLGDDLLSLTLLAFDKQVIFAPTMNDRMFSHEVVRENIKKIQSIRRYHVLMPEEGELACGTSGIGRLPEQDVIVEFIQKIAISGKKKNENSCDSRTDAGTY